MDWPVRKASESAAFAPAEEMVRRLVGVIVDVGRGSMTADQAAGLLASRSDAVARLTAPASGLFLERVYYEGDPRDVPVRAAVTIPRP